MDTTIQIPRQFLVNASIGEIRVSVAIDGYEYTDGSVFKTREIISLEISSSNGKLHLQSDDKMTTKMQAMAMVSMLEHVIRVLK